MCRSERRYLIVSIDLKRETRSIGYLFNLQFTSGAETAPSVFLSTLASATKVCRGKIHFQLLHSFTDV